MFGLSPMHLLLIGVVALLLFGNRLPDVARSLGRSFNEFKRGLKDVGEDDEEKDRRNPPPENPKLSNTTPRDSGTATKEPEFAGTQDEKRAH